MKAKIVEDGRKWLKRTAIDPVFVNTMTGVPRVLAIVVAWKANITPMWLCTKVNEHQYLQPGQVKYSRSTPAIKEEKTKALFCSIKFILFEIL